MEEIIDCHAHIYPEKICEKATASISTFYEDAPMKWNGRASELITSGSKIGVTHYVVHSTATKPQQVESINNFILENISQHKEFIGFGTIHPDYENPETELKRIKDSGIKGIKLHPDFQHYQADSESMDNIYEILTALKMPVLIHAGDYRFDWSGPKRILNLITKHPNLILIAAHMGGYTEWEASSELLVGKNVFFDISSTFWKLPVETVKDMILRHGSNKVLWGSDFPMWDHEGELEQFNKLNLNSEDRENILSKNAKQLLGL